MANLLTSQVSLFTSHKYTYKITNNVITVFRRDNSGSAVNGLNSNQPTDHVAFLTGLLLTCNIVAYSSMHVPGLICHYIAIIDPQKTTLCIFAQNHVIFYDIQIINIFCTCSVENRKLYYAFQSAKTPPTVPLPVGTSTSLPLPLSPYPK